jgi:hypothetical protein
MSTLKLCCINPDLSLNNELSVNSIAKSKLEIFSLDISPTSPLAIYRTNCSTNKDEQKNDPEDD